MSVEKENSFDYEKLGLKCGLEIHQQLDTTKLFCNCPSVLRSDAPDFTVERKLHAVAGESGEVDVAASYQASLGKKFIYQGYETTCLIELDEEPPKQINEEALKIALQVAVLLNCRVLHVTQVMRKTVVDGSNTGGFQRTVLIAQDGYVETGYGKVGIESIALEEDAARIISNEKDKVVYRLDRLGIPLIEIATSPDIKNPEQAKEVALYIGEILRACKVKRGIGTIRQDVNMSIKKYGGNRIEIKGVQEPQLIIKTINSEIERQGKLFSEKKKIDREVRKALPSGETEFLRPLPSAARMYPETDLPLLKIKESLIDDIRSNLPKLKKEFEKELHSLGLTEELIKVVLNEGLLEEFKELLKIYHHPLFVAKMIGMYPKTIASHENKEFEQVYSVLAEHFPTILNALKKKTLSEEDVREVMERIVKGSSLQEAIKFEKSELGEMEEKIMNIIKEKPGLNANAYMGLVMQEFKGKISGKEAMEIIRKHVK